MESAFTEITTGVYLFPDTCNVYLIKRGEKALLVDFGSGHVLDHLSEIGVSAVDGILHTHHHRDQGEGDSRAAAAGIPIHVPGHERHLFDQVEIFWTTKQLYDVYNVRNTYFTLTESVPVAGVLEDYGVFSWSGLEISILPTPGHTLGSVTLLCTVEGVSVAFIGDLIHSPGRVYSLFDLQYSYGAVDGIEATVLSLNQLEDRQPDVLCPSHGMVMTDPGDAFRKTKENLRRFYRLGTGGKLLADEIDFTPVASRLLHGTNTCSSFYVILSRNGKRALFVDYGAPNIALFAPVTHHFEPGERIRFIRHSLDRLQRQYGIREIEAVIPSHYHDDHINGIPYLQRHLGTQVWAFENMKEILENPAGELIGCVLPDPIPVTRTFTDGERFSWEGLGFEIFFSPGHCDYHMSMFTEIDGKRIAFSGDNVWPPDFTLSLIYRNHVHRASHQVTARLYREYRPEVLCSGHGLHTNVPPEGYDRFYDNARELTELFDRLLPNDSGLLGLDPGWIQIYPYQSAASPGASIALELRARSPLGAPAVVEFSWVLPEGWTATPPSGRLEIPGPKVGAVGEGPSANGAAARVGATAPAARVPSTVQIPEDYEARFPKQAIAVAVTLNGRPMGQIAEAVIEFRPYGSAGAP